MPLTSMEVMRRRIVLVVYDGFQLLDLAGPADVFAAADLVAEGGYEAEVTAPRAGQVPAQHGVEVAVRTPLREVGGPIDTLVVVGGLTTMTHAREAETGPEVAGVPDRTGSVCSGAFLPAAAGLVGGRRATTRGLVAEKLGTGHPGATVEPDAIYVRAGHLWPSAGVTAGIDLAL